MSFTESARETFAHAEFEQDTPQMSSKLPLSHQEKAVAELHATIEELVVRLSPVLTPVNEATKQDGGLVGAGGEPMSPLSSQIQANTNGIHRASSNLRGLMERLEC